MSSIVQKTSCTVFSRSFARQQDREVCKSQTQLTQQQQLTASLKSRLSETGATQQQVSSELSATQSQVQQLQQSLQVRQKEYQSLEKERARIESEASGSAANLMDVEAQLVDTQLLLRDTEEAADALKSKFELTDEEKIQAQKQLVDARTGIRNLRNRLDESESDLKRTRVQSSLQVCSSCASVKHVCHCPHARFALTLELAAPIEDAEWRSYSQRQLCS